MNFIKELIEHPLIGLLGISTIILGYILDSFNKSEYFIYASLIAAIIIIFAVVNIISNRKQYNQETLQIPIVINVDSNESAKYTLELLIKQIEKEYGYSNLKKNLKQYRNIVDDDLAFTYSGDIFDTKRLISFMQIIRYQITKIKEHTPNKVQFHLVSYKRPAIGFLLGYVFENEDLVVYQNNPDKDGLNNIANLHDRNYKEEVEQFTKFTIEKKNTQEHSDTILLAIKASSHHINFGAPSLEGYTHITYMKANHKGHIELTEDWLVYAREIFTLLNEYQSSYKKIIIAHNMPESLAIIVGMAIGNYANIEMTQFSNSDYKTLINLNDVICYF